MSVDPINPVGSASPPTQASRVLGSLILHTQNSAVRVQTGLRALTAATYQMQLPPHEQIPGEKATPSMPRYLPN